MKAVRLHEAGGPEVLRYEDVPDPVAGPGQVLINIAAVGVNYMDIGRRRGAAAADLPLTLGGESAGTVAAVGEGVTEYKVGDVVAYHGPPGYAEKVAAPIAKVIKLPAGMKAETGAAIMLQGLTAHALIHGAYNVKAGDRVLVQAGAGGVGMLLSQMAKNAGAYVYATVGSDDKVAIAKEAGADEVINYSKDDFEAEIRKATGGEGVNAVFDAVGKTTFLKGINCLASRGVMVSFGQASGAIEPFDPAVLSPKGLYVTRTGLAHYTSTREEWERRSKELLDWVAGGKLKIRTTTYPLAKAAEAHADLQGRKTTGKLLLIP
jgi:NADPH:quinone reductase